MLDLRHVALRWPLPLPTIFLAATLLFLALNLFSRPAVVLKREVYDCGPGRYYPDHLTNQYGMVSVMQRGFPFPALTHWPDKCRPAFTLMLPSILGNLVYGAGLAAWLTWLIRGWREGQPWRPRVFHSLLLATSMVPLPPFLNLFDCRGVHCLAGIGFAFTSFLVMFLGALWTLGEWPYLPRLFRVLGIAPCFVSLIRVATLENPVLTPASIVLGLVLLAVLSFRIGALARASSQPAPD